MSFKNKILTLSGQPVSGKSTTINEMVKLLLEQGYSRDNIHLVSTGQQFRTYFNSIQELIELLDESNADRLYELAQSEELKRIFKDERYGKRMKEAILELKTKKYQESKISIEKANNSDDLEKIRDIIDEVIDTDMQDLGKQINQEDRPDEIWLIDSRIAFYNIPDAFSVTISVNEDVAAKRLLEDRSRGKEDSGYISIEEAKKAVIERRRAEIARYKSKYDIDLQDEGNYDLIIDTTYSDKKDVANTILECFKCKQNDTPYGKHWTNPKTLLPMQTERDTLSRALYSLEELANIIKEKGYIPSSEIEAIDVDGIKYIIEGHHRNFASAYIGRTLVPYRIIARDDEKLIYGNTARQRSDSIRLAYLSGHAWIFGKDFSYKSIYPELYSRLVESDAR